MSLSDGGLDEMSLAVGSAFGFQQALAPQGLLPDTNCETWQVEAPKQIFDFASFPIAPLSPGTIYGAHDL